MTHWLTTLDAANVDLFDIVDRITGQLKTKAPLDYETQTDYEVTVTATDTGRRSHGVRHNHGHYQRYGMSQ